MATFTPSVVTEVPPTLLPGDPEMAPGAYALFRFFRARPRGVNVYLYKTGTPSEAAHGRVTEDHPISLYDANGVLTTNGWEDLEQVFWGGTGPYTLISDWASVLTAAGYSVA